MISFAKNISENFRSVFFAIAFLSLTQILQSCSNAPKNYNQAFEDKYGLEIERIKTERKSELDLIQPTTAPQSFNQSQEEFLKDSAESYFPYADIAKLGDDPRENFLPNGEVYQQTKNQNPSGSLPEDMFVITYYTQLHPQYRYDTSEFNNIQIPPQDAYGVKTQLLQKPYLMAGNDSLQRSVDHLQKRVNEENIDLSATIIAEQKQLKRQERMKKTFGENDFINAKKLNEEEKKKEKVSDKKSSEESKQGVASNITILDPATINVANNAPAPKEVSKNP